MHKEAKILIMLPVYGRHGIVVKTYRGLQLMIEVFKGFNKEVEVLVIYSNQDDLALIPDGFMSCYAPNEPLGAKLNAGLTYAMELCTFDYLMLWGCDNFIKPDGIASISLNIDAGCQFFGYQDVVMYSPRYNEAVRVRYPIPSGVGRCHSREALERATKCYKVLVKQSLVGRFGSFGKGTVTYIPVSHRNDELYEIIEDDPVWHWWPEYSRNSTDMDSEARLMMCGIYCKYIKTNNVPYILDVKDEDSLSPWLDFRSNKQNDLIVLNEAKWIGLNQQGEGRV